MKKLITFLSIISLLLLISSCAQKSDPHAVYTQFTSSLNQMTSITDKSVNNYLTKRAVTQKD